MLCTEYKTRCERVVDHVRDNHNKYAKRFGRYEFLAFDIMKETMIGHGTDRIQLSGSLEAMYFFIVSVEEAMTGRRAA